jgi:hypothetical protein
MNATQLVQEIKDSNILHTQQFFNVDSEEHDINIWLSQRSKKWVLEMDGKVVKDSKSLETIVNKLVDLNLLN